MTKLTDTQKQQIDDLIVNTILPALQEDVCIPDMSDMEQEEELPLTYDAVYDDRLDVLFSEALNYLKNNLH